MHVGHSYPSLNYSIGDVEIKNVEVEKDLSVTIGCSLDSSLQCAKVVGTGNGALSVIKKTYVHNSQSNIMYGIGINHLYDHILNTVVRPGVHTC